MNNIAVAKPNRFIFPRAIISLPVCLAAVLILARGWDLDIFRHAATLLARGQSPYLEVGFNNPPWALAIILPTLPFPRELTPIIIAALSLPVIARLLNGATKFQIALIVLSPWVILSAAYINLDWIVLGGAFVNPALGVWLLAIKPQAGGGLLLLLLWQAWRKHRELSGWAIASYSLFVMCFASYLILVPHKDPLLNASTAIFPIGVPLGVWLLLRAFRRDDKVSALAVAPLLSPYVGFGSWTMVLPLLLRSSKWTLAAVVFVGWAVAILGRWV